MNAPEGFVVRRLGSATLLADVELEQDLLSLDLLAPGALDRLAAGKSLAPGRGVTTLLELPHAKLITRPVLHGGWLGPALGRTLLGLGRPCSELRVTATLRARGAPVPRPAFMLGEKQVGAIYRATVATFYVDGSLDALEWLARTSCRGEILAAAAAAGRAVRRFHDAGGCHRDLHVKNLLIRRGAAGFECVVIDLDRAQLRPSVPPGERMAELMRLFRSLEKRKLLAKVGDRGLARFFASYLGGDRELRRALRLRLRRERLRVSIHALRY